MGGSLIMLMGSGMVSAVNFGYNITMARILGPADFGHLSAIATVLMLTSAVTLSFQLVCAKFVARNESTEAKAIVYRGLMKRAWVVGLLVGLGLAAFSWPIAHLLRLPTNWTVLLLAMGIAFYVPLGVKRGGLQGLMAFPALTFNFILEACVKFAAALLLIYFGFGMLGAIGGISASVIAAFLFSRVKLTNEDPEVQVAPASFREGMQAIVFFVGQVVINNIDILLVKYFFSPAEAGLYAAVALVGRVLYFSAWSIVSAMFPISAATKPEENAGKVLVTPLLMVLGISSAFALLLALFSSVITQTVFGHSFREAEPLFALYAVASGLYALCAVLMTYEMSRKIANTGWLQLVFSGLLAVVIAIFHDSLRQVVTVQVIVMACLLFCVSLPFVRNHAASRSQLKEAA